MGDLARAGRQRQAAEKRRHETTRELRDEIRQAHRNGLGVTEIARKAGISRQAVYNALGDRL